MNTIEATLFICLLATPSYAQESATVLDAPLVVMGSSYRMDHLLDWNGDGRMDFASISQSASQFNFLVSLNDGHGGLAALSYGGGRGADYPKIAHLETCDGNMDGLDDLLVVVHSAPGSPILAGFMQVLARRPDGSPYLVDHLEFDGVNPVVVLATVLDADLDGDADRVRVMKGVTGVSLELDLFEEDAGGQWHSTTQSLPLAGTPQAIVRMDYDGDAYPDLYLHYPGSGRFVPLAGGVLNTPVPLDHGLSSDMPMAIPGDVDQDGDLDLTIFDADGYVLDRRLGPSSWVLEPRVTGGPAAKFADVDGDGDLDGVCCGGGSNAFDQDGEPSTFRVALNDGHGGFAPAFTFPGLGSRELAGAADLDVDGDIDLAGGQCIYYSRGPLTRPPQRALPAAQTRRSLVDFDRDGDLDFTPGLGTFPRHLGNGRALPFALRAPSPPAGMTDEGPGLPGDWDGDGDVDLLVRRRQGGAFLEMRLLQNEGGGGYFDGGTASTSDFLPGLVDVRPENSFALDLDLDGDLDLVTTRRGANNAGSWTRTWLNDGSGRFTPGWVRNGDWALAFARLTGSAAPDALLVHQPFVDYHHDLYLHPGLGDGSFEATSVFSASLGTDLGAAAIAIADFDADGDLDLAGAFEFGGDDSRDGRAWLLPNTDGSFSLANKELLERLEFGDHQVPARPLARVAHAADVDGDGLMDVVLSSPENRRAAISIVRRKSDNSGWLAPVRQVVYPVDPVDASNVVVHPGAWLDLDGDGDLEYVTDSIWDGASHAEREWGARRQDAGGSPDADGRVPTLGVSGVLVPGNTVLVRLTNVPAGAVGVLRIAGVMPDSRVRSFPERFLPVRGLVTGGPPAPGAGSWSQSLAIPASFAMLDHRLQVDLVHPSDPGRTLRSNVLRLTFGR